MHQHPTPVLLITGASRGLGQALAIEAAQQGFLLVLLARKVQNLYDTADEITQLGGQAPILYAQSLEQLTIEQAHAIVHGIIKDVGRLDGLIHNAAYCGRLAPLDHYPAPLMAQVFHTNVLAPFYLTQAAMPAFNQNPNGGVIVSIADKAMQSPQPHWGGYAASKLAMAHLFELWSKEQANQDKLIFQHHDLPEMKTHLRLSTHPGACIQALSEVKPVAKGIIQSLMAAKEFGNQLASV